jgi:signal transduction histidine kinase
VGVIEHDRWTSIPGIPGGNVTAIVEDSQGTVWIAYLPGGLFQVLPGEVVRRVPLADHDHDDAVSALVADRVRGGVWVGFVHGGIAHMSDADMRETYTVSDGLGKGRVIAFQLDRDGTLWAATDNGLSILRSGRVRTLTSRDGLPCDRVHWAMEDDAHTFWLLMPCGLARIARSELEGVGPLHPTVYDSFDGIRVNADIGFYTPHASKSSDGRLWFWTMNGVSVIDPRRIPFNRLPPPVHVEQMVADHQTYDATPDRPVQLPALVRDLEIDYAALSLVAPEKNRFRVKLEGWDRDWQDVGTRRQAFYNSLPPREYRFRVTASNNSGVWNEAGASVDFSIAPAYYQTTWFRSAVVLGAIALLWAAYQYRLRQVAAAFDARLQERVNERTRIARELHDTLLQSFHGLLFRFQAVSNRMPTGATKQQLDEVIDQTAQAIAEGRDAVQNLRASTTVTNDLAEAVGVLADELRTADRDDAGSRPIVDIAVEGTSRELHPVVRDDVYRIAGEALRNAYRHASARHIEVRIRYDDAQLQVRVRDDGRGIDPEARDAGRPGHFGLPGMRERAELIGGRLDVWSEAGLGTEIELTIRAAAAYTTSRPRWAGHGLVKRFVGRRTNE